MNPPRVIATDLDGTLLRSDRTVSDRTRAALDLAASHGAQLIAVTARPIRWLDRLIPEFTTLPHVIAANGAVCYDLASATAHDLITLPPESLPGLFAHLRAALPTAALAVETPFGLSRDTAYEVSPMDADETDPGRRIGRVEDFLDQPVLKVVVADRKRRSSEMYAQALSAVGDAGSLTYSTPRGLLEIGPAEVSKASTLAAWCAARGISADEVVAFGDMPNDLPMLTWAGMSYAVANAHPEVLAAVTAVTAGHDEDGVAIAVEGLFRA